MSAHASQAFSTYTSARNCTDLETFTKRRQEFNAFNGGYRHFYFFWKIKGKTTPSARWQYFIAGQLLRYRGVVALYVIWLFCRATARQYEIWNGTAERDVIGL